jgi:hypothetical protein
MHEPTLLQLPLSILWILLGILAVEHLVDLLTTLDLFERQRAWFERHLGRFGKLARCFLCQSFWLSGILIGLIAFDLMPDILKWVILWFACHKIIQVVNEFSQRYFGRAPLNLFLIREKKEDKKD